MFVWIQVTAGVELWSFVQLLPPPQAENMTTAQLNQAAWKAACKLAERQHHFQNSPTELLNYASPHTLILTPGSLLYVTTCIPL